ncbi:enoyl-CoA hydratase/isomerase family protein [Sphingomonas sp. MMS24-J45]|uniref:enoyl-CoA hydratase/isomerase family protein n=1 Tax=Sphingomonas sp. MMS24-J45 TaxID=3238806 RepID=UPI0038508578
MLALEAYADAYPYAAFHREGGVLTIRLHTSGSDWVFNQNSQDTLARLMRDVAADRETRVVIVEGTGETFCAGLDMNEVGAFVAQFDAASADRWIVNGRNVLSAFLEVECPIIWCLNGPVTIHPEFWFGGCDIILADPAAYVQDLTHIGGGNMCAGDTLSVWESLLGLGRARYFHLMAQRLDADELHQLGIVHEVVARETQRDRAREIAAQLFRLPPLTLRYSRYSINSRLRRNAFLDTAPSYGLLGVAALETFGPQRG